MKSEIRQNSTSSTISQMLMDIADHPDFSMVVKGAMRHDLNIGGDAESHVDVARQTLMRLAGSGVDLSDVKGVV